MTRRILLALPAVALLVTGACSPADAPATRATPAAMMPTPAPPVVVHVQVSEEAGPEAAAWAEELRTAVKEGHGDLSLASTPEEGVVVVRIDSVETGVEADPEPEGEGETTMMRFALVLGEAHREFSLAYKGDARPQAEALARNLRSLAAKADLPEPEDEADEADTEG
ncbi:MAG: hypothetical protein LJF15_03925 [Acidobacteria bacterium]|jgi:hypothetical protein|nr:hypothetical protein [Acidobacteriota bacterium]